jgi:hypothetical protein
MLRRAEGAGDLRRWLCAIAAALPLSGCADYPGTGYGYGYYGGYYGAPTGRSIPTGRSFTGRAAFMAVAGCSSSVILITLITGSFSTTEGSPTADGMAADGMAADGMVADGMVAGWPAVEGMVAGWPAVDSTAAGTAAAGMAATAETAGFNNNNNPLATF